MPLHISIDDKGKSFIQWGYQKKYYFNPKSKKSYDKAYDKAVKQMKAIYINKYK